MDGDYDLRRSQHQCRSCGKAFAQQNAFSNHLRFCKKNKSRLQTALAGARKFWAEGQSGSKRFKLTHPASSHLPGMGDEDQGALPIAQRRSRLTIRLPPRIRQDIPQPLASLPPQQQSSPADTDTTSISSALLPAELQLPAASSSRTGMHKLDSPHNKFQVFRRYHALDFPSHDPDEGLPLAKFSDIDRDPYAPYPNKSSFLLGEWFWREGAQKSLEDFNALLQVLKDPDFSAEDIKDTQWRFLHKELGDPDGNGAPWLSDVDAGWKEESISLKIPFHRQHANPGNKIFEAGTFHRRSIVSIIRERLADADGHHFHYEPYELHWQPRLEDPPIRVFGELYTSKEFHRVHQELQNSPPESGCDLPRVIAGLMFASDVTQLAQFGDAKLWPVYMFFGNDSKYRRYKPSCHLCNHIAYLQAVSLVSVFYRD
jgi:hypothetical protein